MCPIASIMCKRDVIQNKAVVDTLPHVHNS